MLLFPYDKAPLFSVPHRKSLLRFLTYLRATERQDVTGLTLERFTNPFQGIEGDSLGLVLLQSPECRMTDAGFFGQPIEGSLMLLQQLVNSDSNHGNARPPVMYGLFITAAKYLSIEYIAFLTYMPACYSLVFRLSPANSVLSSSGIIQTT